MSDIVLLERAEAERLTEGIRIALDRAARGIADLKVRVAEAYQRRADLALGYESWAEYAQSEFGEQTQSLAAPIRRELVVYLSAEGMSTRAIAPAVGVTHKTVVKDNQANREHLVPKVPPTPEPTGATIATDSGVIIAESMHVDISTGEIIDPEPTPAPEPRKVTGIDGKQYTATKQKEKPKRRSLIDTAYNVNRELYKVIERIRDITTDDRYTRNKADIQAALQPSISLAQTVLTDLTTNETD